MERLNNVLKYYKGESIVFLYTEVSFLERFVIERFHCSSTNVWKGIKYKKIVLFVDFIVYVINRIMYCIYVDSSNQP